METDTPDTDAKMFMSWKWDTRKMDYVPHGVVVPAEYARKLERERDKLKEALIEMRYSHTDKAERMAMEALGENK